METSFEVRCKIILKHTGTQSPKLLGVKTLLLPGTNIDSKLYFRSDDLPSTAGVKVIDNILIQGLLANISYSHQEGMNDSAAHLRWIISELERGFVQVSTTVADKY